MQCLSEIDRKSILGLAREAVTEAILRGRLLQEIPKLAVFESRCGVFVTLHANGKLRGCIGVIEPKETLGESIARSAAGAALDDPRFKPVKPEELSHLHIEVSLLSPLERIAPEQIEIGEHGVLIEQGLRRGLLLPQVAVEHRLTREEFLRETCHKAGLPLDAWNSPETRVFAFTCEVLADPHAL